MDSSNGRFIAYLTMLAMLGLSIAGNVSHTLHLDSTPSTRSVVYAIMWPVMVWLGVEMFVRVQWSDLITHKLVRWVGILLVSSIAALVSYRHLRGLLIIDGEDWIVSNFGPLAIDGLMLMATLALLLTRKLTASPVQMVMEPKTRDEIKLTDEQINDQLSVYSLADLTSPAPVSPAAPSIASTLHSAIEEHVQRERKTRASNGQTAEQVRAMLEDPELKPATSTMRRYASVARTLRNDPHADVSTGARGVRTDIIEQIIRPWARMERVR